jgi:hypothetical protein
VWSRVDARGRARLVKYVGTRSVDARVPPKDGLFDPDVGSDRRGRRVIVYTRCAGVTGQNCDIWVHRRKHERTLPGASTAGCSEYAPSVWRGRFAFVRTGPQGCNGLYLLRRGRQGRLRAARLDSRVPADTDIRGSEVAYLYSPAGDPSHTFIRVRRPGGRSRLIVAGFRKQGERTRVSSPVLYGGYLYWLHDDRRRKELRIGRTRLTRKGSRLEFSDRTLPGRVDSIAVTRGVVFYTNGRGVHRASDPEPIFLAGD